MGNNIILFGLHGIIATVTKRLYQCKAGTVMAVMGVAAPIYTPPVG